MVAMGKRFGIASLVVAGAVGACSDDAAGPGGGGGGSVQTTASAGGAGGGADDLAPLSDTFDGGTLDPKWTLFNDAAVDAFVAGGSLSMEMTAPALWFQSGQGTLLHQTVSGDFRVTATVHVRKTSAPAEPPDTTIHLGGLMARDPASDASGSENYVFIVAGFDEDDVSVETKSTTNDVSDYIGPAWPSTDAELRMCRVGASFHLYKRPVGAATWELAITYDRPDLPAALQVGANAYCLTAPDLTVQFEAVTFARVTSAVDCTL